MSGVGARVALVVVSLAAGGGAWYGAGELNSNDDQSGIPKGEVSIYDCPVAGSDAIGVVNAGDELQLLAVTDDRWAVIQHPANPDRLAWLPLAMVDTAADAGDLPQLTCDASATTTETTVGVTTTTAPLVTDTSSTTTSSTTTSTSIATTTTVSSDVTPPTVTLTANRAYFYVPPVGAACLGEDQLDVTVAIVDPTFPLSVRSIQATWMSPSGVAQTAGLTPIGGNRFRLQILTNGPNSGELLVTITATGSDGAGNVGSGQLIVPLRKASSFGCA